VSLASTIYGKAVHLRNSLYDRGRFRIHRLAKPVISVGNISAGGAGKTPFVILLGQMLKERGVSFDVLSRGYKRRTKGALEVNPHGSARDFGDEPLLIARRLGCPVIVGEDRYEAGRFAETKFSAQAHILDDGFQHRRLARDFDIVLLTPEDVCDQLLPAGRLREPISSLGRADAVVLTGEVDSSLLPPGKRVWRLRRTVSVPKAPDKPVVFCGIARPKQFISQLEAAAVQPVALKFYSDHYSYAGKDIQDLIALRDRNRGTGFITTAKDAINLGGLRERLGAVAIAEVKIEWPEAADALDTILRVISGSRPGP